MEIEMKKFKIALFLLLGAVTIYAGRVLYVAGHNPTGDLSVDWQMYWLVSSAGMVLAVAVILAGVKIARLQPSEDTA